MRSYGIPFWRSAPMVRLLVPFVTGMVLAEYTGISAGFAGITGTIALLLLLLMRRLPVFRKYQWRWITGIWLNLLLFSVGAIRMQVQQSSSHANWIGHHLTDTSKLIVTLQEPLVSKSNSYKSKASIDWLYRKQGWERVRGHVLLYFAKDSAPPPIRYGSVLVLHQPLQRITGSGNPGSFDYATYCARQDIHYQAFLRKGSYSVLDRSNGNAVTAFLIRTRNAVLGIIRKAIPSEQTYGVAEALLIGYRDDLDKNLVLAYSNTGVVHIIAISGLHLGMIYGLLLLLLKPFRKQRWLRRGRPLIIVSVLWGFSLLAGAGASILRSVVMFSFIVIGESLGRKSHIHNTLAASACCLLLYHPYFLWDVGFQLSYTAVLSIVTFMNPLYRCQYFNNPLLKTAWQLNAITISAQVFTLPLVLYYFHQFPNLFLFTNFIAVPLSGIILYGEMLLLLVYPVDFLNQFTGTTLSFCINLLNRLIEQTSRLPFAVTGNIPFSLLQLWLLYGVLTGIAAWLFFRRPAWLIGTLCCAVCLILSGSFTRIRQKQQQKLIVYNIPRYHAIDIMEGSHCLFLGDVRLRNNTSLTSYHLLPSRTLYGVSERESLDHIKVSGMLVAGPHKTVLVLNQPVTLPVPARKIRVDLIILGGNPDIDLGQLASRFACAEYIFDSSNPLWKIRYWKKAADSLHLRHQTISEQGAYEMDL